MKIGLLVLGIALVLGGLLGALVIRDPGYVLLAYDRMAVETSLWFAVLVLVAVYFVIRALIFLALRLARGPVRVRTWNRQRRARSAREQTANGLRLMAEGDWRGARDRLEEAAPRVSAPLVNYLGAARAAQAMGDTAGRDELLHRALESTPGARLAVGLTRAELQHAAGQWEQCLATLLQLRNLSPRQQQVLRLLADCYLHLKDWPALIELLPELKRRKANVPQRLDELEQQAWHGRFSVASDDPKGLWKQVPRELQQRSSLVLSYVELLAAQGDSSAAEQVLRAALNRHWDAELVRRYGVLQADDPGRQLVVAEGWLKERPNDPELLLALGRISMTNRQWSKAREYLEASLRLRRSPEVQGELGRLCVALGDVDRGSHHLQEALQSLPSLPLPERSNPAPG